MKPSAVKNLICLDCRSPLALKEQSESRPTAHSHIPEIIPGTLGCTSCPVTYPITEGVPRFVQSAISEKKNLETGKRFGQAWKEFPRMDAAYKDQFFDWIFPVKEDYFKDKVVLEAGCGKGRHAQIISQAGAAQVYAIDIGEAVDVAYRNVGQLPNVHIIQADICNLPFAEPFDFAFSVGVLHHMSSPGQGFASICGHLKDNGSVLVWVYGRENNGWLIYVINPIRLAITSKMPAAPLKILSFLVALPVFILSKFIYKPYCDLRRHLKFLPDLFYSRYMSYIARFDFSEIHHIVFDHLVAPVSNYLKQEEVKQWFLDCGFDHPTMRWHNCNSWTGFSSLSEEDRQIMRERVQTRRVTDVPV